MQIVTNAVSDVVVVVVASAVVVVVVVSHYVCITIVVAVRPFAYSYSQFDLNFLQLLCLLCSSDNYRIARTTSFIFRLCLYRCFIVGLLSHTQHFE